MVRLAYKVAFADFFLLVALASVLQDLAWRAYYAGTPHASVPSGYSAASSYSLLTRVFTMSGGSVSLASPVTLDWVQVLVLALVLVNGWFAFRVYASRRVHPLQAPGTQ